MTIRQRPCFQEMLRFVINTGAKNGRFNDRLLEYDRRYVDHKKRALPLQAFGSVNALPNELPRSKVAILMRAYSKPPSKGVCPCPESSWGKLKTKHIMNLGALPSLFSGDAGPRSHGARR